MKIWVKLDHEKAKRLYQEKYPAKVIKRHINILKDQVCKIQMRIESAQYLIYSTNYQALDALVSVLMNKKELLTIRRFIAQRLSLMFQENDPRHKNNIDKILTLIHDQDEDNDLKYTIAKSLSWTRKNAVMELLITAFTSDNYAVRYGLLGAGLENFKDLRLMGPIINILADATESPEIRCKAAIALGQVGNQDAVEPLIGALENKNNSIRLGAIIGLLWLKHPLSLETLIQVLLNRKLEMEFRYRAAIAIGEIRDSRGVTPLVDIIQDESENNDFRKYSIESLGKIGNFKAINHLIRFFNKFKNRNELQYAIIRSLGQVCSAESTNFLAYLLNNDLLDNDLRKLSAEYIGINKHSKALNILLTAVKDKNSSVRYGAIMGLRYLENTDASQYLLPVLLNKEEDANNREAAAYSLFILEESDLVVSLNQIIMDRTEPASLRKAAILIIGYIGDNRSIESLVFAINDECEGIRRKAAESILNLLYLSSIKPLWSILRDKNQYTRKKIMVALRAIKYEWLHPDMKKIRDVIDIFKFSKKFI